MLLIASRSVRAHPFRCVPRRWPRIWGQLRRNGTWVGEKRVAGIMGELGITGVIQQHASTEPGDPHRPRGTQG